MVNFRNIPTLTQVHTDKLYFLDRSTLIIDVSIIIRLICLAAKLLDWTHI